MAKKTIKPPAIKRQKINNNAWMTDFHGYRHEGDVHTGKSGVSAWPFCRLCCARVETGVVNRNFILKRGRRGGGNPGTLLGLGNVACNGWLRVGTRLFNCQYCILIVTTVCYDWPNYGGWGWHLQKVTFITCQGNKKLIWQNSWQPVKHERVCIYIYIYIYTLTYSRPKLKEDIW